MTFDTMKMQKKYQEAGFDPEQSRALVEGQQEGQSELATKADVKAIVSEQARETDKAIGDLKVIVSEQARETDKAIGDLKVTVAEQGQQSAESHRDIMEKVSNLEVTVAGLRTEIAKANYKQLLAMATLIGLAVAVIKWL